MTEIDILKKRLDELEKEFSNMRKQYIRVDVNKEDKTKMIAKTMYLTEDSVKALDKYCKKSKRLKWQVVSEAILEYIARNEK